MRTKPPDLHKNAFLWYGGSMSKMFGDCIHEPADDRVSAEAHLKVVNGGLGLRPPAKVAAAACLASQASATTLAQGVWPGHRHGADPSARHALAEVQDTTQPDAAMEARVGQRNQTYLTGLLDGQGATDLRN